MCAPQICARFQCVVGQILVFSGNLAVLHILMPRDFFSLSPSFFHSSPIFLFYPL